jgi:hypothetical protein
MRPGLNVVDEMSAMADIHERADQGLGTSSPWLDIHFVAVLLSRLVGAESEYQHK